MALTSIAGSLTTRTWAPPAVTGARLDSVHAWVALAKPRIVSLVVFTAVVASFAAAHGAPAFATVAVLVVSGVLSAGGAAALNHYFDRDIDGRMARTRGRPLVQGQIRRPSRVLLAGLVAIGLGIALAAGVNLVLAAFELAGGFVYVAVYTLWLKRRSTLNIVVGGFAGSAAVVGGWAAVDPGLGLVPWLLGGVVFVWTPAHFWSLALVRAADYRSAGIPMLPVVAGERWAARLACLHIVATVALSCLAGVAGGWGTLYFAAALLAGIAFLFAGTSLLREPGRVAGWTVYKLSGPYLGFVFLGLLFDMLVR